MSVKVKVVGELVIQPHDSIWTIRNLEAQNDPDVVIEIIQDPIRLYGETHDLPVIQTHVLIRHRYNRSQYLLIMSKHHDFLHNPHSRYDWNDWTVEYDFMHK